MRSRWHLACVAGPDIGALIPLPGTTGECNFGRENLAITDTLISRTHAKLRWDHNSVSIYDHASANGTTIQRHTPIRKKKRQLTSHNWTTLKVGDELHCGQSRWQLRERPRNFTSPPVNNSNHPILRFRRTKKNTTPQKTPTHTTSPLQHVMRTTAILMTLFFLPLSISRILGIPPWWIWGALALITLIAATRTLLHARPKEPWDGAHLLLALDASPTTATHTHWTHPNPHNTTHAPWPMAQPIPLPQQHNAPLPALGFSGANALLHALWSITTHCLPWGGCQLTTDEGNFTIGAGGPHVHFYNSTQHPTSCPLATTSECAEALHIIYASDVAFLPAWCTHIIENTHNLPVSRTWAAQILTPTTNTNTNNDIPDVVLLEKLWQPRPTHEQRGTLDAPIGTGSHGQTLSVDLITDGPHGVIVGTTGSGKSEALISLLCSIAHAHSPHAVRMILIDYKGGASLTPLDRLPHVETLLTDLTPQDTQRAFDGLGFLLRKREAQLAHHGYASLSDWESQSPTSAPPRVIIAFDEFTTFAGIHPELFEQTLRLAAQGRALGLHVIFATQRPDRALNTALLSNIDFRIALRSKDAAASHALIGSPEATELPHIPGRAIMDGHGTFQTGWLPNLRTSVTQIRQRWPHITTPPLWEPPLPTTLTHIEPPQHCTRNNATNATESKNTHCHLGLIDGVTFGAHYPLRWIGGHCRIEGVEHQRDEIWRTICALSEEIATHTSQQIIVCSTRTEHPFSPTARITHIHPHNPIELIALAATTPPNTIITIEDTDEIQRCFTQSLGAAHGQALWNAWLTSAHQVSTTIIAATFQPRTLWDKESHFFTYRFLKAANAQHITMCALPSHIQATTDQGHFLVLSCPPQALCLETKEALSLPITIRLLDPTHTTNNYPQNCASHTPTQHNTNNHWIPLGGNNITIPPETTIVCADPQNDERIHQWAKTDHTHITIISPKEWIKLTSDPPSTVIILTLTEEIRRTLLPLAYQSDWLLRIKYLPNEYALLLHNGTVTLLKHPPSHEKATTTRL